MNDETSEHEPVADLPEDLNESLRLLAEVQHARAALSPERAPQAQRDRFARMLERYADVQPTPEWIATAPSVASIIIGPPPADDTVEWRSATDTQPDFDVSITNKMIEVTTRNVAMFDHWLVSDDGEDVLAAPMSIDPARSTATATLPLSPEQRATTLRIVEPP